MSFSVLCAANAGCLLSEPINEAPEVGPIKGPDKIGRNSSQQFTVDADTAALQWGWLPGACPADLAARPRATLGAAVSGPAFSVKTETPGPVCVWVLAQDSQGAETLVWKDVVVENQGPTATISFKGLLPTATPVFALYQELMIAGGAMDAEKDGVMAFAWTITLPDGSTMPGTPCAEPNDGSVLCFSPPTPGKYAAHLAVTDSLGMAGAIASTSFEVRPDQLPCVRDTESGGAGTILRRWDEDVAFTVAVDDDGDPFPPREGQSSKVDFVWLLRKKETGRQNQMARVTDYNQASFRLPAQSFVQGDEIEVRVEVLDRMAVPLNCAESEASCVRASANAPSSGGGQCSQRMTWTVRYIL
ncbi:MAG: hypothetical protein SF187_23030 [Deltaproteobacteria bacterium]|nr:hypothetical protein [Deltaproteobacteria bacterium]